jgi:HSP20 family protein
MAASENHSHWAVIAEDRRREDSVNKSPAPQGPTKLKVVYGEGLGELERDIQRAIGYRAYELYSQRGRSHGHDLEDWFRAESDLVRPGDVQISNAGGEWIVRATAPGFSAAQLRIGASPRKIIIWAEAARPGSAEAKYPQQLLGEIELPAEAIPEQSRATLTGDLLEVRISKRTAAAADARK